jgi:hypothetical protein
MLYSGTWAASQAVYGPRLGCETEPRQSFSERTGPGQFLSESIGPFEPRKLSVA